MRKTRASTANESSDPGRLDDGLDLAISEAAAWLTNRQHGDGHWVFELEADATIPSEYILANHFMDEINDPIERRIAQYLRRTQGRHGGWSLYHDGDFDLSASVKAYFALKMVGDDQDLPHMRRACAAILEHGGAARANVFTRILLALFGQVPWRAAPWIRPEAMLMPAWAPFHIDKVSYWSRTVMVPLFILAALKPRARNPRGVDIRELFVTPPELERRYMRNPTGERIGDVFLALDHVGRIVEPLFPRSMQRRSIDKAAAFIKERLNGEDGLGGIFPAMAYSYMAFDALEYPRDHPDMQTIRSAMDKLLVLREDEAYVQPCLSPIWDTGLALHALLESGVPGDEAVVASGCDWLVERQVLDVYGDWTANRPNLRPGGWAFQYRNDHYPDVDDTAVIAMALHRAGASTYDGAVARACEWVIGMQSRSGGWGAFDADNEHYELNSIPFADHGALLDPPTADVTARCLGMLIQVGHGRDHPSVARALDYLKGQQEADGSWFGRWGTNYVYGTWSVLCALNAVGEDMQAPYIRRAVGFIKSRQREDGGWGEDCASYWPERRHEVKTSTPSQTSWALLALMAAGDVECPEVRRGVAYLLAAPREGGQWHEEYYNAVGFPRVFYLRYYGYSAYFPLWALARYRNLKRSNTKTTSFGI
ncbi:MAG: squalene--hopene cyclase [Rhodospirillales bacterium]|nr:squalene--hopene cyclase [Rhodospirillales bacterium]